jgi:hypothetical protein
MQNILVNRNNTLNTSLRKWAKHREIAALKLSALYGAVFRRPPARG